MRNKQIINQIAEAFRQERFPTDRLYISSADHVFDSDTATDSLKYEHWSQIPTESLIRNRDRISYLTNVGFRFLLPAFLTESINHPHQVDVLKENIILSLVPSKVANNLLIQRANTLTSLQVKAIIAVLEGFSDIYPSEDWSFSFEFQQKVKQGAEFWKTLLSQKTDT